MQVLLLHNQRVQVMVDYNHCRVAHLEIGLKVRNLKITYQNHQCKPTNVVKGVLKHNVFKSEDYFELSL